MWATTAGPQESKGGEKIRWGGKSCKVRAKESKKIKIREK
jgi:hypothetical protein